MVNSDVEAEGGSAGVSWIGEDGFLGVAGRTYDSDYGNPAEEEVRLDLRQRRLDVRGGLTRRLGALEGLRFRFGRTDYEHAELEGAQVGTRFVNDAWEARLDSTHRPAGPFRGSFGIQASSRSFEAIGEEAFVPPTENDVLAAFLFEEIGEGPLRWQMGLRHESQDSSARGLPDRSFSATSASLGALWSGDGGSAALTVSRAVKLPDPEELYADGPHIATGVFEIGDPGLDPETSLGVDLALRGVSGRLRAELDMFANRARDYIFAAFTGEVAEEEEGEEGEEEEPLPIVRFVQDDAEFVGAEAQVHYDLIHREPHHLELEIAGDLVRAELRDSGEPLPRIPPRRLGAGLSYRGDRLSGSFLVRRHDRQDRVAENETETPGYTTVDASLGIRLFAGDLLHELILGGTNLTDELARSHVSFLKEVAPLPGRDLRLTYRLVF